MLLTVLWAWCSVTAQTPTENPALGRKLPPITQSDSIPGRFAAILRAAGLSGGVAYIHAGCSQTGKRYPPPLEDVTAAQALDALASEDRSHRWEETLGSIVFLPAESAPGLLYTTIVSTHISDVSNLNLSLQELLAAPELAAAARRFGITDQGFRGGFAKLNRTGQRTPPTPIDIRGISLLQALNLIAREREAAVWSYDEYECHGHTFQLTFIAE